MINFDTGIIDVDVYFLKHLLECIKHQKSITNVNTTTQAEWQAIIDITIEQVEEIIKIYNTYQQLKTNIEYGDEVGIMNFISDIDEESTEEI